MFSVAVYLVDLAYGGPEEGGWYYECGQVTDDCDGKEIPFPRFFASKEEAHVYRAEMQKILDEGINVGRREISSVISEGKYRACVKKGWPKNWPEERPYYS